MLALDLIGLILTTFLVGLRYFHYVLVAAAIGEISQIFIALYVNAQVVAVVAGGIFGQIDLQGINAKLPLLCIYFGGPLINLFVGLACGGLAEKKLTSLFNPFAKLKHPFAVINIRLAVLSAAYNGWQHLAR